MQIIRKLLYAPRKFRMFFYILWNRVIFKLCGVKYGHNMRIYNHFYLNKYEGASISIGDNFIFTNGEAFNPLCRNLRGCIFADKGASIKIGHNTGISSACIWAANSVTIGNNVKIGGDCIILDTDAHSLDYLMRRNQKKDHSETKSSPIIIEDDVLVGTRCIILKGVTIGARSIIGSGSIVTKSIPSDCIAAGNPCHIIKKNK